MRDTLEASGECNIGLKGITVGSTPTLLSMAKEIKIFIPFSVLVIFFIGIIVLFLNAQGVFIRTKPGDMWVKTHFEDDPFRETLQDTLKILEVKNGYVKYEDPSTGRVDSGPISWTLSGAKKIN